tara:strand:+ start:46 stop:417 length:372 start_codon:yes stop_codon:yes gene_type:complete
MENTVQIKTRSHYIANRSDPALSYYFFSYEIKILNNSKETIKLLSRYWHIIDAEGGSEHIYGPGVVGKNPVFKPGDSFQYTSFCPLPTPLGSMGGVFRMIDESGDAFDARVDRFQLTAHPVLN